MKEGMKEKERGGSVGRKKKGGCGRVTDGGRKRRNAEDNHTVERAKPLLTSVEAINWVVVSVYSRG